MGQLRRIPKKRLLAFLVLFGLCYVLIFEYQYIDKYQERHEKYLQIDPVDQIWTYKPNLIKSQTIIKPDFNETFLESIRKMFIETKSYIKLDTEINNTRKAVPFGVGRIVAKLFENKTGGSYFEIGIGHDEEDQLITWLETDMNWAGLVVEPNIQAYNMNSGQRSRAKFFLKCVKVFGKEWYHSRGAKGLENDCIPLEAIFQALFHESSNSLDLLAINSDGFEDAILNTLNFQSIKVNVVVVSLRGALKDTRGFHMMMEKKGYRGRLISNNHSTGKTYIVFERIE